MFVSNSNPPNDLDTAGEVYKMRLDGSVMGKFGRAGKLLKEFGTVNAIDCRGENTLYGRRSWQFQGAEAHDPLEQSDFTEFDARQRIAWIPMAFAAILRQRPAGPARKSTSR